MKQKNEREKLSIDNSQKANHFFPHNTNEFSTLKNERVTSLCFSAVIHGKAPGICFLSLKSCIPETELSDDLTDYINFFS